VTPREALTFVRSHGVVLASARGPVPSLAEAVAGEPIRGSWRDHPRSHEILDVTRAVRTWNDVIVCRLVRGEVTFVHRDLWPALVRCAGDLPPDHLAQVIEYHAPDGRHVTDTVEFPAWVPAEVARAAENLSLEEARAALGPWIREETRG